MAQSPTTYRGEDASIQIEGISGTGRKHGVLGISDFSLTLDRGTVEQELVGEAGNYFVAGSLSCEGSLTACKLDNTAGGDILAHVISGSRCWVSGNAGPNSLKFFFASCMITGFDLSLGDADTITEGSMDFTVQDPQNIKAKIPTDSTGVQIGDSI
jgi:hypothetical protein